VVIQKPEIIERWIKTVQDEGRSLTAWEEEFIESIAQQFERKRFLSDRQEETLEKIYAEKTP